MVQVQVVDGKVTWRNRDVAIAACGFANTAMGGVLICGVHDKTKEVIGIDPSSSATVVSHITQALTSCASPPIRSSVSSIQLPDSKGAMKTVVVVDIPPARELTEAGDLPRAIYQRHGDQNVKMQGAQLDDLRQGWRAVHGRLDAGDVAPVPRATLPECLDLTKLEMLDLRNLAGVCLHLPQPAAGTLSCCTWSV